MKETVVCCVLDGFITTCLRSSFHLAFSSFVTTVRTGVLLFLSLSVLINKRKCYLLSIGWNVADSILYSWVCVFFFMPFSSYVAVCCCCAAHLFSICFILCPFSCYHFIVEPKHTPHRMNVECDVTTRPQPKQLHSYARIVPICSTNIIGNIRL